MTQFDIMNDAVDEILAAAPAQGQQVECQECERLRMQLVACGVVALSNTPESGAKARDMHPDYMSTSCQDVMRAVDSEMALRAELSALKAQQAGQELDELRRACAEILGQDPEAWPSHGNAPLAIASALALAVSTAPKPHPMHPFTIGDAPIRYFSKSISNEFVCVHCGNVRAMHINDVCPSTTMLCSGE